MLYYIALSCKLYSASSLLGYSVYSVLPIQFYMPRLYKNLSENKSEDYVHMYDNTKYNTKEKT
jgi:hypothetical protein